jgi:hypothetical protein
LHLNCNIMEIILSEMKQDAIAKFNKYTGVFHIIVVRIFSSLLYSFLLHFIFQCTLFFMNAINSKTFMFTNFVNNTIHKLLLILVYLYLLNCRCLLYKTTCCLNIFLSGLQVFTYFFLKWQYFTLFPLTWKS